MNFKMLLDEAINRGEKIKEEVLAEIIKSKTIKEIVSNKNFIKALTRIIETKQEVKKVIDKQTKQVLKMMDVPTNKEVKKLLGELGKIETLIAKLASKHIPVKTLKKVKLTKTKKVSKPKAAPKKKTAVKKTVTKKKVAKKKVTKKKTAPKKSRKK